MLFLSTLAFHTNTHTCTNEIMGDYVSCASYMCQLVRLICTYLTRQQFIKPSHKGQCFT